MNNEIQRGDKVKVSKDAPKVYLSSVNNLFKYHVCKVEEVDGDSAIIRYTDIGIDRWLAIPTKYLVKVDAEAKEPRFKYQVGQKVILHFYGGEVSTITEAFRDGGVWNKYKVKALPHHIWNENELDPYAEPTEQTEADKKPNVGISEKNANEISDMLEAYAKALSGIADPFDWQIYEADLAKEIVLKTVNSASDRRPMAIAEYATDIAKAVVEGLKRK